MWGSAFVIPEGIQELFLVWFSHSFNHLVRDLVIHSSQFREEMFHHVPIWFSVVQIHEAFLSSLEHAVVFHNREYLLFIWHPVQENQSF